MHCACEVWLSVIVICTVHNGLWSLLPMDVSIELVEPR